ncbi:histidine kinase [Diaminobutyricimonas aerilata]|uniref:histidine kinase n=1 Tax=Diaminobutyricimonas aerilata TaxID=1162967 RepID=A0A2M9CN58_9MICO|nr:histidine kinase [Diaminobutyricimonas aerilata]PJJ73330.1 histidine kinase [Diaminobutyricimonas aerilata]
MRGWPNGRAGVGVIVRRALFLLLGGLAAVPYAVLVLWAVSVWVSPAARTGRDAVVVITVVALALLCLPAFLQVTRDLERTAARALLDVTLPDLRGAADVLRGAVFFAGHVLTGGLTVATVAFVLPVLVTAIVDAVSGGGAVAAFASALFPGFDTAAATGAVVIVSGLVVAGSIAGGLLAPWCADVLLGPTPEERARQAAEREAVLARRTDLARELHDTIGHALTVTSLQATAAARILDTDPEAARAALGEIERIGRRAAGDLDYALGVLRSGEQAAARAPAPTLAALGDLTGDARAAGLDLDLVVSGDLAELPDSLSRELYRVAQEGLTNALRHGSGRTARLEVRVDAHARLELSNPVAPEAPPPRAGRGLTGIRERLAVLQGEVRIESGDGLWRLVATAPLRTGSRR